MWWQVTWGPFYIAIDINTIGLGFWWHVCEEHAILEATLLFLTVGVDWYDPWEPLAISGGYNNDAHM